MSKEPEAKPVKANDTPAPKPVKAAPPVILDETPEFKRLFEDKVRAGLTDAQARECALNQLRHDQALAKA